MQEANWLIGSLGRYAALQQSPVLSLAPYITIVCADTMATGKISRFNYEGLLAALLDHHRTKEDLLAVQRLLFAIRRGWLRIER